MSKPIFRSFSFYLLTFLTSIAVIAMFITIFSSGASAVSIKQYLFSTMTGVVNMHGEPAANVRLVRTINYNKDIVDETVTDEKGYFEFPAVHRNNYAGNILPMEFVVSQLIMAHHEGKEYEMWAGVKRKPEENAESRGKPLEVTCELGLEDEHYIRVNGGSILSLCTWNVEADPERKSSYFDEDDENEATSNKK